MSASLLDGPLFIPSKPTPPAVVRPRPEILSRAEIARRRQPPAAPKPIEMHEADIAPVKRTLTLKK